MESTGLLSPARPWLSLQETGYPRSASPVTERSLYLYSKNENVSVRTSVYVFITFKPTLNNASNISETELLKEK